MATQLAFEAGEVRRRFWTVEEVYRMTEAGVFAADEHIELLEGELYTVTPPGKDHIRQVDRLVSAFADLAARRRAILRVQSPVNLGEQDLPEPDLALLKPSEDFYLQGARASDVLLVIEVSATSLSFDLNQKVPRYAAAGVPEVWIVDLQESVVWVFREPAEGGYLLRQMVRPGETLAPLAFPDHEIIALT